MLLLRISKKTLNILKESFGGPGSPIKDQINKLI